MLQNKFFSQLMFRHSEQVKSFMKHRSVYKIAQDIGEKWGASEFKRGTQCVSYTIADDGHPLLWLYAGEETTVRDVAIFIDEHIEGCPELSFSSDWSKGAEPDLVYRYKNGAKIRFLFDLHASVNCELVETEEIITIYKRVCK